MENPSLLIQFNIQQTLTVMVFQFMINYVQQSKIVKISTSIINFSLISFGSIIILQKDVPHINFAVVFSIIKDNISQFFRVVIIISGGNIMFYQFFYLEWIFYLEQTYKKSQLQKECYKYLDILDQVVISKTENGIRYFNSKGVDLVKTQIQALTEDHKFNIDKELQDLHNKMFDI